MVIFCSSRISKCFALTFILCTSNFAHSQVPSTLENGYGLGSDISLPAPYATESVRRETSMVPWPEGVTPSVPDGFVAKKFAGDLNHPRWIYILPNDDVLIAESNDADSDSADRITLFRDRNRDGVADERHLFLNNLNQPFGMTLLNGQFYVANTDGILKFPYEDGANRIKAEGETIHDLPSGGYNHHWTRNLMASDNGTRILFTIGSSSNVGEHGMDKERRRAKVLSINPDGSDEQVFASGLRNANGLDYNPVTGALWAAVNERDKLGDDLVPDYVTSVQQGGFYGWPYKYFGENIDPRWEDRLPEGLPEDTLIPDIATGSHTATMDLSFYEGTAFPQKYHNGLFAVQHGSWNRARYSGYKVIFMPFVDGKPTGEVEDFMTGFLKSSNSDEAYGRPSAMAEESDGTLLIVDDDGNSVWSVQPSMNEDAE